MSWASFTSKRGWDELSDYEVELNWPANPNKRPCNEIEEVYIGDEDLPENDNTCDSESDTGHRSSDVWSQQDLLGESLRCPRW